MASVGFYHLTKTSFEQALPALLTRTMQIKEQALVLCKDDQQVKVLTEALWRITHPTWLPHGCHTSKHEDDYPEWQPIWLTTFEENVNKASFLFLMKEHSVLELSEYKRVFDLFDGNDESAVTQARSRWRSWKQAGHELTYWKQNEKGWEQGGK